METVLTGCKLGKVLNQNFLLKFDRRNVIRQIKLTLSKFIKKCQSKEVQKARQKNCGTRLSHQVFLCTS